MNIHVRSSGSPGCQSADQGMFHRGAQAPVPAGDEAEPVVKDFHRQLDPTNTFNPGIGKTSKRRR